MKHIQAYTRTEDEAEAIRMPLIAIGVHHVEIGRLELPIKQSALLLAPIVSNANGLSYAGGTAISSAGVVINQDDKGVSVVDPSGMSANSEANSKEENASSLDNVERQQAPDGLTYVVSVKVDADTYGEALHIIRRHGGYVE